MEKVSYITHLNSDNYNDIISTEGIKLLKIGATWCGPCRMIDPKIDELSVEFYGKAMICKLDADESRDIITQLNIRSVPTLIVFKDGVEIERTTGNLDMEQLRSLIKDKV